MRLLLERGYRRLAFARIPITSSDPEELLAREAPTDEMEEAFVEAARRSGVRAEDLRLICAPNDPNPEAQERPETYGLPRVKPSDWRPLGIMAASDIMAEMDRVLPESVTLTGLSLEPAEINPLDEGAILVGEAEHALPNSTRSGCPHSHLSPDCGLLRNIPDVIRNPFLYREYSLAYVD